jgi:hypothetical protein
VVLIKPIVEKQHLHHSCDWWFVTAKTTCFLIMCSKNWYHQHILGWVPFTPSYLQTNQNQPSMIMEIKTQEINYIAYLLVHKSTNAKDQKRDFCQSSDHVSIATDREQQDWHKLELWLQLTCKCWQDWCSFTFFHVSSHRCKWSKTNRIPQHTFVLSICWNSSSAFCHCPCFACTKWKILMPWILVEQAPSILNAPHFLYLPTKLLPTWTSESQTLFKDVHIDPHALFKCKCKLKLANKHRNRQWDQHQQPTQHQAAKENQPPLS